MPNSSGPRRRSGNLSTREDICDAANALSLNASKAAEAGIAAATRKARAAQWREENKASLNAHNARVEKDGVLLTPDWALDD